jgi:hypothetical protein
MDKQQKVIIAVVAILVAGIIAYLSFGRDAIRKTRVDRTTTEESSEASMEGLITGEISPISGVACENWNRRPFAFMQPVDKQARPVAGFSQADMVFEMPNPAAGIFVTRLMGVFLCEIPEEVGALRSARHDYIALAKALDAVFVGWGGSAFALKKLDEGVIENIDCNGQAGAARPDCCFRKERTGAMRVEDTGFVKGERILECAKELGYRSEGQFEGYLHRYETPEDERPEGGHLHVRYPGIMEVEYDYDRASNSFFRTWGEEPDLDRNNGVRIAPRNIVVMVAENEQILAEVDYVGRGTDDPWEGLEEKRTGIGNISGRYNNLQMGDPWYDLTESGDAKYYIEGKEYSGSWKKSTDSLDSKLIFLDESGEEIAFIPGQIWVEVVIPSQKVEWTPGA